jgi:isochorismate synthase
MSSYAIFRLPHHDTCTLMMQSHGEPFELSSLTELNGKEGFVIAPFVASAQFPILLLKPDVVETMQIKPMGEWAGTSLHINEDKEHYVIDFANFHAQLESGVFRKIVLARKADVTAEQPIAPEDLFMRACNLYPRMFVALVSTERSGTWLMATPEILLEGGGDEWHTIALAGTMKLTGEQLGFDNPPSPERKDRKSIAWSDKNIQEQRYVATYITQCLEQFTDDFVETGPYTARAADLVHLRSDFDFKLNNVDRLGDVINELHPTPAVCGIPKDETREFIMDNESSPRKYYSGFLGPLFPHDHTHLFVSLRCMQIVDNRYSLYAGGGLLNDSVEQMEWDETKAKMETMLNLMHNA